MTPQDVKNRVAEIEAVKHDDERAHVLEDKLWRDVLFEIAVGNDDARALAGEALRTSHIDFSRWCA